MRGRFQLMIESLDGSDRTSSPVPLPTFEKSDSPSPHPLYILPSSPSTPPSPPQPPEASEIGTTTIGAVSDYPSQPPSW